VFFLEVPWFIFYVHTIIEIEEQGDGLLGAHEFHPVAFGRVALRVLLGGGGVMWKESEQGDKTDVRRP
jgi:hypothetical protein